MRTMAEEEPIEGPRRRTLLAAERTWLAWWRTALGTCVAAIGVGAVLPKAIDIGHGWLYAVLGIGYALIAIAAYIVGAVRRIKGEAAIQRGEFDEVSTRTVVGFTIAGAALATMTIVLLVIDAN